ncbi:978b389d-83dd-447a-90a9-5985e69d97bc [Sclerotinia trifoliorum]|uniref:978b389d-83dd-447a-90a9-5985e69d97bc n=1 Tax=Sclerotinia trifoliorum TaxID=28548 RepID=A0A8H2ZP07_9HELO|nr:978b389d-83dd-447a-90a9-5985e69d97bc [Sclerotinia trifoliorum]
MSIWGVGAHLFFLLAPSSSHSLIRSKYVITFCIFPLPVNKSHQTACRFLPYSFSAVSLPLHPSTLSRISTRLILIWVYLVTRLEKENPQIKRESKP